MRDAERHESEDLVDYEVLDSTDTLDGPPGDDPLDRGIVAPERWSAAIKYGTTAGEQEAGESLDQLLAEEEPDVTAALDDQGEEAGWDENATEAEIARYADDDGTDTRAGRLVSEQTGAYGEGDIELVLGDELIAHDEGIDGGAASAEEAAVHLLGDDDEDTL